MAFSSFFIFLCTSSAIILAYPLTNEEILTQPKPGEEYVFVQTSGSGARPIARKDKHKDETRPFETSHKLPPSLTYILNEEEEDEAAAQKVVKREAKKDAPAPAPAGAIKLDVSKLLEKYKDELKTTTTAPKASSTTTKSSRRTTHRRTKKEAKEEAVVTSPSPILTTGSSAPKAEIDDIPLVASGSEKQRSRIQIKKGPNGQEYEYEYVYYYYDDDEDPKVNNSHDGPAKSTTTNTKNSQAGAKKNNAKPEANEVVPSSKSNGRGRQIAEDEIGEERLPANTRFPPRSRNLNTTPLPEEETKPSRGRGRGRPTTEAAPSPASEADNVSDETREGSRGRTRSNVRRPSLDLVDNASFNTHSNTAGAESAPAGPSFPTELPAGPEPTLKKVEDDTKNDISTDAPSDDQTTVMSAMDKVALDLYAILQGTQKLSGEDGDNSTDDGSTDTTNETEITTLEPTTEITVETTTPTTTTTTTTTTAPTTTTTTTTEAPVGRGRFKDRGRKTTHTASTTEAAQFETKPKSKFNRPSFGGRPRLGAKTTSEAPVEQEATKEQAKPVSHSRPTLSRSRFGASRTRTRTTAAPESGAEESSSSSSTAAPSSRPSLTRPRSSFNLRTRGRTTTAPTESDSNAEAAPEEVASSTTARTRRIQAGSGIRPLRPGPRINLGGRGRPGHSTTTEAAPEEHSATNEETSENAEEKAQDAAPAAADSSPLSRLKNKHRVAAAQKPKAAASAPVQVRRVNPLINRRRPGQTTEAPSSEAPQEASVSTETSAESEAGEESTEAAAAPSSTTTEEPRGLNKLLAGRRRVARPAVHS